MTTHKTVAVWSQGQSSHALLHDYIVDTSVTDQALLGYEIRSSIVHAQMLGKMELVSAKESQDLVEALEDLSEHYRKGSLSLTQEFEDMHSLVEHHLIQKLGATGKKLHTGRSRNDQVLLVMRLWSKDQIKALQEEILELGKIILSYAKEYEFMPMIGHTHTQPAMPSSIGQWAGSFTESLLDDYEGLTSRLKLVDQNPLGSASGFGTTLPIDRDFTTDNLGFERTQINTLYCQNSRGKIESAIVSDLMQVMLTLDKIASDIIWFSHPAFGFFTVDECLTTGSSIMPQKKNLDILEVLRANTAKLQSNLMQLISVSGKLTSGYHKDLKTTKKTLMESFEIVSSSVQIMKAVFEHLTPNENNLLKAFTPEILATDEVNELVMEGMPFREAYMEVKENLGSNNKDQITNIKKEYIIKNLKSKTHLGAPGNLGLELLEKKLKSLTLP